MENMAYGVEVPIPTLGNPPDEPTEKRGGTMPFDPGTDPGVDDPVEVEIDQALKMLLAMVEVAEF